jgi:competence protein ComEC
MERMMKKKGVFIILVALGLVVIAGVVFICSQTAPNASLQVSFINVGQGDSALIRDSGGFDVLIDGGKSSAGPTVVAYLRNQGVGDVDVMVASHADADHISGLIDVLEANDIPVEEVLYNGYPGNTATWFNFTTAVANDGLTLTAAQYPMTFTWGSATAHILNPAPDLVNPEQNDSSVVVLLDQGDIEYLFTGDIDSTVEATVVARGTPVAAEIIKLSRHGSKYSSSADFLTQVQPAEAIISVGSNPYGHPAKETLTRLPTAGARIWRTDESGTILVTSDGTGYTIVGEISFGDHVYLPLFLRSYPLPTPTPTPTATTSAAPTATSFPTPIPSSNQLVNPCFDGEKKVLIDDWEQTYGWDVSIIKNPCETGNAARLNDPAVHGQATPWVPEQIWQIVPGNGAHLIAEIDMTCYRGEYINVNVYGSADQDGPWALLWVPFSWSNCLNTFGYIGIQHAETDLGQGYKWYKFEVDAMTKETDGKTGAVKVTSAYFESR